MFVRIIIIFLKDYTGLYTFSQQRDWLTWPTTDDNRCKTIQSLNATVKSEGGIRGKAGVSFLSCPFFNDPILQWFCIMIMDKLDILFERAIPVAFLPQKYRHFFLVSNTISLFLFLFCFVFYIAMFEFRVHHGLWVECI